MSAHLTEEEQIEAIKRWWQDNGKFTVVVILMGVIGWFGWNNWQDRQERLAQQASSHYAELMTAVSVEQGEKLTEEQIATAKLIAGEIVEAQQGSLYGNLAALLLAKLAVESGELAEAESHVQGVIDNAANQSMSRLAKLRLARILTAQEDYERALALLDSNVDKSYRAAYAEARGDIYLAQQQLDLAHTAYQEALANLGMDESNRRGILQVKADNTLVADTTADDEAAEEPAEAPQGDA